VRTATANQLVAFNDRNTFTAFGKLHCCAFATRARANDHHVKTSIHFAILFGLDA
jgi:hypothetical protein